MYFLEFTQTQLICLKNVYSLLFLALELYLQKLNYYHGKY